MQDWAAQSSQIEIPENPLSVNIDNPQNGRFLAVTHCNEIMLSVLVFHEILGNFEYYITYIMNNVPQNGGSYSIK